MFPARGPRSSTQIADRFLSPLRNDDRQGPTGSSTYVSFSSICLRIASCPFELSAPSGIALASPHQDSHLRSDLLPPPAECRQKQRYLPRGHRCVYDFVTTGAVKSSPYPAPSFLSALRSPPRRRSLTLQPPHMPSRPPIDRVARPIRLARIQSLIKGGKVSILGELCFAEWTASKRGDARGYNGA